MLRNCSTSNCNGQIVLQHDLSFGKGYHNIFTEKLRSTSMHFFHTSIFYCFALIIDLQAMSHIFLKLFLAVKTSNFDYYNVVCLKMSFPSCVASFLMSQWYFFLSCLHHCVFIIDFLNNDNTRCRKLGVDIIPGSCLFVIVQLTTFYHLGRHPQVIILLSGELFFLGHP